MNPDTETALIENGSPEWLKASYTRIQIKNMLLKKCPDLRGHGLSQVVLTRTISHLRLSGPYKQMP